MGELDSGGKRSNRVSQGRSHSANRTRFITKKIGKKQMDWSPFLK